MDWVAIVYTDSLPYGLQQPGGILRLKLVIICFSLSRFCDLSDSGQLQLTLAESGWLWLTLADSNGLWRTARVSQGQPESSKVIQSWSESARFSKILSESARILVRFWALVDFWAPGGNLFLVKLVQNYYSGRKGLFSWEYFRKKSQKKKLWPVFDTICIQ